MKKEIPALTGLRFLAAAAIVLDHVWPVIFKFDSMALMNDAMHQLAYVGMTLFFVLSGFIIHYNYADVVGQRGGMWRFFVARLSRLYPLYLLVLIIDFTIFHPPVDWMTLRMLTMTQSWTYEFNAGRFLSYGYHYSVVAWSISTEVFFYLVYPAIGAGLRRMPALASAVGGTIVCAAALWWIAGHPLSFDTQGWFSYASPYTRILQFAVGCTLAHAYRHDYRLGLKSALVATSWIALFVLRGYIGPAALSVGVRHVGLLLPTAVLIYAIATSDAFSWLSRPFAVRMGDASYSTYLLHLIVAEYFAFVHPLEPTQENFVSAIARFVAALVIIGVGSRLSYRFFEAPARKVLRHILMGGDRAKRPTDGDTSGRRRT